MVTKKNVPKSATSFMSSSIHQVGPNRLPQHCCIKCCFFPHISTMWNSYVSVLLKSPAGLRSFRTDSPDSSEWTLSKSWQKQITYANRDNREFDKYPSFLWKQQCSRLLMHSSLRPSKCKWSQSIMRAQWLRLLHSFHFQLRSHVLRVTERPQRKTVKV